MRLLAPSPTARRPPLRNLDGLGGKRADVLHGGVDRVLQRLHRTGQLGKLRAALLSGDQHARQMTRIGVQPKFSARTHSGQGRAQQRDPLVVDSDQVGANVFIRGQELPDQRAEDASAKSVVVDLELHVDIRPVLKCLKTV